jgi:hypothetical protein
MNLESTFSLYNYSCFDELVMLEGMGYINGSMLSDRFDEWLQLVETCELIDEACKLIFGSTRQKYKDMLVIEISGTKYDGFYLHPYLFNSYASWLSPEHALLTNIYIAKKQFKTCNECDSVSET